MPRRLTRVPLSSRVPVAIAGLSSMLVVALLAHMPIAILADAGFDDAWFWQRGADIASGEWMGDYGRMTLIKGSGYPLFLALNHALGVSLVTTQAVLYAGACLLMGAAVLRISARPWLSLALVLAMQWHPAAMAWTRVLRDSIGAAQVLLTLACLLLFVFAAESGRRGWRWAILAGLALGWLWSTREDAIWVLPGVALLLGGAGWQGWRDRAERRRLTAGVLLMGLAFCGWLALVAGANLVRYGVFTTVETRGGAFSDALSSLQRVRAGPPVAFAPVPRETRYAVYAVSPAFARLQPYLEGEGGGWKLPGCALYPRTCGDYAGGWFMWAFRDAAASVGAHAAAPAADAFYRQVARDVSEACADGRLRCAGPLAGKVPRMTAAQWRTAPARLRKAMSRLFWQRIGDGQSESHVGSRNAHAMWSFVGKPMVPDAADALDGGAGDAAHAGIARSAASPIAFRWIKYGIGLLYAGVLPWMTLAGLLAFCWATLDAVRSRRLRSLYLLAAMAWCLVAGRSLLLVLVDMSSFPALEVHYLQPVFALLVLAAVVSVALLATGSGLLACPDTARDRSPGPDA